MSESSIYQGIFVPLVTAFNENETLNLDACEKLVEHMLAKGAQGFYVGGSSGECYLQCPEMRKEYLTKISETVKGRVKIIAHVGANSTSLSIELGQHALNCGYDAITSTPPFYFGFSTEEVTQFYQDLSDNVALPLLVYYAPGVTGVSCKVEQLENILAIKNVYGIKYTTTDMYMLERLKTRHPDASIFHGADEMLLSGLVMGADGGIGSTYNLMVDKYVALHQAFKEGNLEKARELQANVNQVTEILLSIGVIPSIKYLLTLMGLEVGDARRPFAKLKESEKNTLSDCYQKFLL